MAQFSAIIYGVGSMGQLIARMLLERGVRIAGAIGHKSNVGRDLGEVIGWPQPIGVSISADADAVLHSANADIVALSVGETMEQSMPYLERCVVHGYNVISLSEQVFYPWRCAPELSARIDALAKQHQVTVSAGGMQDVYWVNLATLASASCHRIKSITGISVANGDPYGPAVLKDCLIGEPASSFQAVDNTTRTNVFTIGLEALAADLQLDVTGWSQDTRPIIATAPVVSQALGRTIAPGEIQGLINGSRVSTREGIELAGEIHLKILTREEMEATRWIIDGDPPVRIECPETHGHLATCATLLNRIPDVVEAAPGLVTIERLPKPKFKQHL